MILEDNKSILCRLENCKNTNMNFWGNTIKTFGPKDVGIDTLHIIKLQQL